MVVQHNLRAMNSNRMLGLTANVQAKSTEKLSSGYKINRAADDAAGLSISEKMRKQIRGLSQASLNAQDGISAVQTAEGALNEVQDMLQRMNELAVKAANGTMSESDRSYIQNEIDQLTTEIDRVAETTKFNETYLLKGVEGTETVETEASIEVAYEEAITGEKTLAWAGDGKTQLYATKEGKSVAITEQNYKDFFEVGEETVVDKVTIDKESKLYNAAGEILSADEAKTILNDGGKVYNTTGTDAVPGTDYAQTQDKAVADKDYTYVAATAGKTVINLDGWKTGDKIGVAGTDYTYTPTTMDSIDEVVTAIDAKIGVAGAGTHTVTKDGNSIVITTNVDTDGLGTTAAAVSTGAGYVVGGNAVDFSSENGKDSVFALKNAAKLYDDTDTEYNYDDLKDSFDDGTVDTRKIFTSKKYYDAADGHTVYDVDGNVMSAKAITDAHAANNDADDANDVRMFTTSPVAAVEGKDYTVETKDNTVVSVKDGYAIYNVSADENTKYGNQKTTVAAEQYSKYFKVQTDLLMDKDENVVAADKLGEYFEADGTYKGGLYKYNDAGTKTEVAAEQIDDYVEWKKTEAKSEEVATEEALTLSLQVGADSTANNKITVDIESMSAKNLGVDGLKVDGKDSTNADAAVDVIAAAIEKVSAQRSALGAVQNRLEHTIANLDNVVENTTAAESQIRDTDMATEMVKFSNNNILAQAGQAMLAQANQANQGVLSLLG